MKAILFIICLGSGWCAGFAQNVNVLVTDIREERQLDQKSSSLELRIKVNGITVDENRKIKIGRVIKATDNLGNELKQVVGSFDNDYTENNEVKLKLGAPARNATHLDVVEATLKYFTPTKANKGLVEVVKPLDRYNTNLLKGLSTDVGLILIDEAGLKKLKEENEAAYNKEMEKFKKENPAEAAKMGDLVGGLKSFFESMFSYGSYGPVMTFLVDDPKDKIVAINVYDEQGTKVNNGWSKSDKQLSVMLSSEPKNTWKLEVLLENPQSVKEHTFKLGQVFLP
ncbi:MAG: hypothetical protein KF870_03445 [Leadbetterella sp.]|nr:hypothetical protein [Leadbetterella sp.]